MTPDEVRAVVFSFPAAEESVSLGSIAFKVNGTMLCRLGARTGPDDLMLSDIGFDESEMLIARDPATFHITPHFTDAKCVLARIGPLDPEVLLTHLDRRWRKIAPKSAVKARDAR